MLITARDECGCRGCGGFISVGERVSWVDPIGPYHINCTPKTEDVVALRQEIAKAKQKKEAKARADAKKDEFPPEYTALITAAVIAIVLIVGAIVFKNPPGYYMLLRLVVCALSAYLAFRIFVAKRVIISVLVGFVAVTYNPLLPVRLQHDIWQLINIATLPLLVASLYVLRPKKRI